MVHTQTLNLPNTPKAHSCRDFSALQTPDYSANGPTPQIGRKPHLVQNPQLAKRKSPNRMKSHLDRSLYLDKTPN
jgi:hypothetical protein